jgi:hypothetical protein
LEARIAQAAGEGTRVQISGLLYGEGASCYLEVSQLDFLAPDFEPTRAPEAVTAWKGVIVRPPGNPRGQVFVRDDGEGYDVGGQGDEVREAVQEALETGARVRIWGTASYGVPASRARHIEITRLEFVSPRE